MSKTSRLYGTLGLSEGGCFGERPSMSVSTSLESSVERSSERLCNESSTRRRDLGLGSRVSVFFESDDVAASDVDVRGCVCYER